MKLADEVLDLYSINEKAKWYKLKKDVKSKEGDVIPRGTMVKILKKIGKKTNVESPDGLTAEIKI